LRIELRKVESDAGKRECLHNYIEGLAAPVDGFRQNVEIAGSDCLKLELEGEAAGHLFVARGGTLLQYGLSRRYFRQAGEILDRLIEDGTVGKASVSTKEPEFLGLCLDRQKGLSVDCYLFEDLGEAFPPPAPPAGAFLRPARAEDIPRICEACDPAFDGYYEGLVANGQLFVACGGDELLGIGEMRVLDTHGGRFSDIGMHVAEGKRCRGVGAFIVAGLGGLSRERGAAALACCNASNAASKRALEKAGFRATHRVLDIAF
jgi:hypothetical protein